MTNFASSQLCVRHFVGCDQRSKFHKWCAGAGSCWSPQRWRLLEDLRAGTPQLSFSPLVTPYGQ